jgi:hypothetical protein
MFFGQLWIESSHSVVGMFYKREEIMDDNNLSNIFR